jgi:hypothetical protein
MAVVQAWDMKTWPEWLELWQVLLVGQEQPDAPPFSVDLRASFIELERESRRAVDIACGQYAEFGDWPVLSMRDRWWLRLRLLNAAEVALILTAPYQGQEAVVPAPGMDDDEALAEWFLIFLWQRSVNRWADRFSRDAGGPIPPSLHSAN